MNFPCYKELLRCESEVTLHQCLSLKNGLFGLTRTLYQCIADTLIQRVKQLLGLWTWISKVAYQSKPCTLIMNENNEQSHQDNLKKIKISCSLTFTDPKQYFLTNPSWHFIILQRHPSWFLFDSDNTITIVITIIYIFVIIIFSVVLLIDNFSSNSFSLFPLASY